MIEHWPMIFGAVVALLVLAGMIAILILRYLRRMKAESHEQQLLAEHLRVTLRSIGDAVLVTDAAGRVTMMNPVAEDLSGWSEAEALGRPVAEIFRIINEETRATVDNPIDIVLREGRVVGLANHTLLISRDGTERPIADSGAPIRHDATDEIGGVVLVFRDQSEEQRMNKALAESRRQYAALLESSPVGISHLDASGNVVYANDAMRRLVGVHHPRHSPELLRQLTHPDDSEVAIALWQEVNTSGLAGRRRLRYLDDNGKVTWMDVQLAPNTDDRGDISSFVSSASDVTAEMESKNHAERLSRLYATLSQVNSAIIHCREEQELYERIADIMVGKGGFASATIILVDMETRTVKVAAVAGVLRQQSRDPAVETNPRSLESWTHWLGEMFSKGSTIFIDPETDERMAPGYREVFRKFGLVSYCISMLSRFGQKVGMLSLASTEKDFFSEEILALIDEVVRDISFALENFARESQRREAEEALARNEERLRLAMSVTHTGMYEVDFNTSRVNLSAIAMQLANAGNEALEMDYVEFLGTLSEARRPFFSQLRDDLRTGNRDVYSEIAPSPQPDGTIRWLKVQSAVTAERSPEGKPVRLFGMITDVTEVKQLEDRARLAATVFDNSGEGILIADSSEKIEMVNQSFLRDTGFSQEEFMVTPRKIISADHGGEDKNKEIRTAMEQAGYWQGEAYLRRKDGNDFPALLHISQIKDSAGHPTHWVVQETDISARKAFEQRISHLAYRDALTELPNRMLLHDRVEQSIALAHREGSTVALLYLDLDYFKNINDSLGHAVGDDLLKVIAARLSQAVREMDTVGRLGGDEFLLLLPDTDADAAGHVAQKLLQECARPFAVDNGKAAAHSLTITSSIGIALYPRDGEDFNALLKAADTAMYRAKEQGRNAYRFFTPEMNQAVFQHMMLESSMRRAIEQNEFVLHYQPMYELSGQRLIGVEALIRWHRPEMGMISPGQFIPVAEESDLIVAIGQWVLEEACRQINAWRAEGLPALCVSVNFSARQFAAKNVVELVAGTLNKFGVSGDRLEIEITESLLAQDIDHTLAVMRELKQLGVQVAIDDFGTGYSSLSYLKRFPIDRLKIDQSFVRDLDTDADDRAIATAIVTLGHSLGMRVIAEGVATLRQLEILRGMGCDEIQGYYLGRPVAAGEIAKLMRLM